MSIVECCSNYEQNCMRLEHFMSPIVKIVDEKLVRFEEDVKKWERDIQEVGDVCTYVSEHSRLKMPKCDFTIFPSIHNGLMLAMSYWDKRICIGEKGCAGARSRSIHVAGLYLSLDGAERIIWNIFFYAV